MAETAQDSAQELTVYKAPWAQLKGVGIGELELTRTHLVFYKKKRFGNPVLSRQWELDHISNLGLTDDGAAIDFEWLNGSEESGNERVLLGDRDMAQEILGQVGNLMEEARVAEVREQANIAVEAQLREERLYRSLVWNTMGQVWNITGYVYRVVSALKEGRWQDVDICIQALLDEADNLRKTCHIDIVTEVEAVAEQAAQREMEQVVNRCVAAVEALGEALDVPGPPPELVKEPQGLIAPPVWTDVPFLFLFGASFWEVLLSRDFGEFGLAEEYVSKLLNLAPVLKERFGLDLEELLWEMVMALKANDRSMVSKKGDDMTKLITRAIKHNTGEPEA